MRDVFRSTFTQRSYFLIVLSKGNGTFPSEIFCHDIAGCQCHFNTLILGFRNIGVHRKRLGRIETTVNDRQRLCPDNVFRIGDVIIECQFYAVVQETGIQTNVSILRAFPSKLRI